MPQKLMRKNLFVLRRFIRSGILITIVFGSLLSCSLIDNFVNPQSNDATATRTPALVPPNTANATPVCFWNWANNNAKPEHIDALTESLDSAEIEDYEVVASAYGEDKICQVDGETVSSSFYMMDISPTITLAVDSIDTAILSETIRTIVIALKANETLPKINRVEILFGDDSDSVRWTTTYNEVTQAIADDINDDDLFALGQG